MPTKPPGKLHRPLADPTLLFLTWDGEAFVPLDVAALPPAEGSIQTIAAFAMRRYHRNHARGLRHEFARERMQTTSETARVSEAASDTP